MVQNNKLLTNTNTNKTQSKTNNQVTPFTNQMFFNPDSTTPHSYTSKNGKTCLTPYWYCPKYQLNKQQPTMVQNNKLLTNKNTKQDKQDVSSQGKKQTNQFYTHQNKKHTTTHKTALQKKKITHTTQQRFSLHCTIFLTLHWFSSHLHGTLLDLLRT